jgi:alpha-tubulin suppressor-like RCC1 family protein
VNDWGQLGFNNQTNYSSPKQVGALTTWSQANGGNQHTLARTTAGSLWAWGRNTSGQLGINVTYYSRSSPVQVGALTTWASVNIGVADTSVAVRTNGTLWTWGLNSFGQLGIGNTTDYSSPKQVGALTNWTTKTIMSAYNCFAIKSDGTLWSWGWGNDGALGLGNLTNYSSPKQIGALTSWQVIASGQINALAIKTT